MKRNISIKNAPKKLKTLAAQKNVRLGTYTTVTTAVVIALLLVLNLSVSALPEKYMALDTTSADVYSISEQTKEIVGELEQDLTIYYIVQEGSEDETVLHLLEHYMDLSDHVKVQQIDPVENPNFVYQYAGSGANTNSLVVASGERSRYVDYYDIYESEYNYTILIDEFNQQVLIPYSTMNRELKKRYKSNPKYSDNWTYNAEDDYYIDPQGVRFDFKRYSKRHDKYGFERNFKVYEANAFQ